MNMASILAPVAVVCSLSVAAWAWVPKADIKAERSGATSFVIKGKNSIGDLEVKIEDQHLFRGFKGEGKNGSNEVKFEIKSAGIGSGWKIEGKNGDVVFDLNAKQKAPFSNEWNVTGKVGDKKIDETITGNWDVDPAIEASVIAFDV
jgi:hypothetical protein